MTLEQINEANELADLERQKKTVHEELFLKAGNKLSQDVLNAGKSAMLGVIDEAIDHTRQKLDKL